MATLAKTVVATGASSGLGFEAIRQLLFKPAGPPYNFILGARNVSAAQAAYDALKYDSSKHSLTILPLELNDLRSTRSFSQKTLQKLGPQKIDYLFLNAAITNGAEEKEQGKGPSGLRWCEGYVVNHLSQHYLIHLFREKLEASRTRIVVVSSGGIRRVEDTTVLETDLVAGSQTPSVTVYCETKFIQLLAAHWWRRQFSSSGSGVVVVAVSPGLIPNTGISRGSPGMNITMDMPDAKTVPEGAASLLAAFFREDLPEDPEQIFLTSWGEWWAKDVYGKSLDKELQDKWCPSKEEIEQEAGNED